MLLETLLFPTVEWESTRREVLVMCVLRVRPMVAVLFVVWAGFVCAACATSSGSSEGIPPIPTTEKEGEGADGDDASETTSDEDSDEDRAESSGEAGEYGGFDTGSSGTDESEGAEETEAETNEEDDGAEEDREEPGYDARLSEYDYPYEVDVREFEAQGESLEMALMDVRPEGEAKGTVLLLHGKNFSGAYWKRTIEALVDRGYRVIAPDQIGFGKSSKPAEFQYSFQALATHTRRMLDDRGVGAVTVVGHSMGGMLATRFALMFPDRTERLALVNPIGLEDWKRKAPYRTIDEWYERELEKSPEAVKSYMKESYFDGTWKEAYDPLVEIQAGWIRGPDYDRIARVSARTYDMIFTQPVLYEFSELEVPTLLIIGQRDRTALGTDQVDAEVAETMGRYEKLDETVAEQIPSSELVELEGIGHVPQFEAFERYIGALTGFMEAEK